MKRNFLLYLLMMAFSITFFAACGDDDDDKKGGTDTPSTTETTWKDGTGSYNGASLVLNGNEGATTKTVAVATGSGDNAKITLTNIVPDDAAVVLDNVEMKKSNNDYTFESETTVGTTTISVKGTLSGIPATKADAANKKVDITVTRKITSPVAGTWKLNFTEAGGDVFFDVSTGDAINDAMFGQMGPMLGGMMAQKVTAVTSFLNENGIFDVNFMKVNETEVTGIPPMIAAMVGDIMYFASDDQLFIAVNKALVELLPAFGGQIGLTEEAIGALVALLVDKGDYYALPINMSIDGDTVSFYASKELLGGILPILAPMLGNLETLPEQIKPLMENLPVIVANSEIFNVGLRFSK